MKIIYVVCILLLILGSVSAVSNAKCEGNTLVYYDMDNKVVKRDCSILHSGGGQVFRGVCKSYEGGADCWRTEGAVTPDYRDAVRGYVYNSSDVWDQPYNPTITTTTLPSSQSTITSTTIPCPKCQVCDCKSYISVIDSLNMTKEQCDINLQALRDINAGLYSSDTYNAMVVEKETSLKASEQRFATCQGLLTESNSKNNIYSLVAAAAVAILVFVVVIWVKYEWIGDPKLKDGFGKIKKRKV